ncbi:FliM/FliN family flagellar motor switch protein [Dyella acidisoli]|uniref:FliM/FliN family flagellar motor switch protein n=1 Tax=Dyella acidisoli TaxID=1867834 RepID=UPI0024E0A21D|nr:FliM/FliN family flagellar motor switch protein [Dyella acidisoli]
MKQISVMPVDLPEHVEQAPDKNSPLPSRALLDDIKVRVDVSLGTAEMTVKQLMSIQNGSIVELEQQLHQETHVLLNGKVIARGEIVAVNEHFGIRITHVLDAQ